MPEYIFDPVETDHSVLEAEAREYIQSRWPDWDADAPHLEDWLISACTRIVSDARDVASEVPRAIFRYWGAVVLGLPPVDPTPSTVDSTWELVDNPAGRTIEAGTWVMIEGADGEPITFEVVADVVLAPLDLATDAGAVSLRSLEEGAQTEGLGGAGAEVEPQDPIAWVDTITLDGPTIGGQDGEDDDEYLDRLSARLTLLTPRPILPDDFELMARDLAAQQGVDTRAVALDGYNPADATFNNEKMITLAMIEQGTGADLPAPILAAVGSGLQDTREVNFVVNMIDPNRSDVDITYAGVAMPGYDPDVVKDAADSALLNFLDPARWGTPIGAEVLEGWINIPVVRVQDVSTVLNSVEGFSHWTSLTIGINGGAQANADANLAGAVPLAEPGVVAGAVVAP